MADLAPVPRPELRRRRRPGRACRHLRVTGSHLAHLHATSGLATCHAHGDCSALSSTFLTTMKSDSLYPLLFFLGLGAMYFAPAIIGILS